MKDQSITFYLYNEMLRVRQSLGQRKSDKLIHFLYNILFFRFIQNNKMLGINA